MSREKVEFDVIGRDTSASKTFRQVGDAAEKAGDQVEDLGAKSSTAGEQVEDLGDKTRRSGQDAADAAGGYRGLAAEIEHTQGRIRSLAEEIDRTGNKDLIKDLRRQQSELRKLNSVKALLPDAGPAGAEAASKFSAEFVQRVGPLVARAPMGPVGAVIGGAVAVAAVPSIAAAIQGAVVGGVGIGGVIGGVALASRDARVQAAGKQLGENLLGDLEDSGSRFVEPTLAGIREIQDGWNDVSGDIDAALAAASRYVEPLAEGVADFVREIAPGIRDAAEAAEPIVQVVSEELPEVGAALSDMLSSFSEDADTGASAIRALFFTLENGIDTVSGVISAFSAMYGAILTISEASVKVMDAVWGWIPGIGDAIDRGKEELSILRADFDGTGRSGEEAGGKAAGGIQKVETAAVTAAGKVETLNEAIGRMAGENISSEQAAIRLEEAIDRATGATYRNNAGIDRNTPKGRENRKMLIDLASAANDSAAKILEQTGSHELAAEAAQRGRTAFLNAANAMNVERGQAIALADKLFAIPNIKRTVTIQEKQAMAAIARVQAGLGRINSKDIHIGVYWKSNGDLKLPGGTSLKGLSMGGPVTGPGPRGVDSEPRLLAPGEYVLDTQDVAALGGFKGVDQLRRSLHSDGPAVLPGAPRAAAPAAGGVDASLIGREVARALAGMTLVLDDRTGRTASLISRGA